MESAQTKLLVALIQAPDHLCYRYRIGAFLPALVERGWRVEPIVVPRGTWAMLRQRPRIAAADVVVLQRRLYSWWHRELIRSAARVLVFDFDDAVYGRDSGSLKPAQSWRCRQRFRGTVRMADAVTAGNAHLVQQAGAAGGLDKTHYLPTCINPELYEPADHQRPRSEIRLVWIGNPSTTHSLSAAGACLAEACRRVPGTLLQVISSSFPELPGVPVVPCPWSSATEALDLAAGDIGVSWLPEHPWSLGKCGLKVLQYMSAGLPVVANPTGIHRELVRHGETGFLAATPQQWADAIARLASAPALRTQMGRAGRAFVQQHYSVARWQNWLGEFFDTLALSGKAPQKQ